MLYPTLVFVFLQALCVCATPVSGVNAWSRSEALYSTLIRGDLEEESHTPFLDEENEKVLDEAILLNNMVHGNDPHLYGPLHAEERRLEKRAWDKYHGMQERLILEVLAATTVFGYYINRAALANIPQNTKALTKSQTSNLVANAKSYTGVFRELGSHAVAVVKGMGINPLSSAQIKDLTPAVATVIECLDNTISYRKNDLQNWNGGDQGHIAMCKTLEGTRKAFQVLHACLAPPPSP